MSTIPFTLIEGSMALPRMCPLGRHLPAPFGRDWAYRPPGYSLRIELKALYAAVIHTFCMSDQTFRSFCKWVPLMLAEPCEAIADARRHAVEERATSGQAPRNLAEQFPAEARVFAPTQQAAVTAPSLRAPDSRNALAGSACALTGAALLAWIVISHPTHRPAAGVSSAAKAVTVDRGMPPAQSGPANAIVAQTADNTGGVSAPHIALSPANVGVDSADAQSLRSGETSGTTAAPTPALAESAANESDYSALRHREDVREKTAGLHEESRHGNAKAAASYKPAYVVARNDRVPGAIDSTIATQALPTPSTAGPYSPSVPTQPDAEQYASVTTSAATPVRAISQPPRVVSATESSVASKTEWMSHLSQRRVTEIPDQFSK